MKVGEPETYHEKNFILIGVFVVAVILFLVSMIICWRFKCYQKIKRKFMKKEIVYEMYGEFKDESSAK